MLNALTIDNSAIKSLNGLYSLNDLHRTSGGNPIHRPNQFLRNKQTVELIKEIEIAQICAIQKKQGLGTFACKELVIAYASWISPAFNLKVLRVFLDKALPNNLQIEHGRPTYLDEIYTLLCEKFPNGIDRPYAWGRFNKHFRISSYKNLPIERFNEAKEYISNIPPRPIAISAPNETLAEQINRLLASVKEISIKEKESIQKSFIANIGMPKQYFDVGFAGVFDTATCQFRSFGHRAKQVNGIFDN